MLVPFTLLLASLASARPLVSRTTSTFPELEALLNGNRDFINEYGTNGTNLIADLAANGQHPSFLFIGCSDSRVSEGTIFDAPPGTLFVQRNIANQFRDDDLDIQSAMTYATEHLHVKHILVLGHYGCGGVAASVASPPPPPLSVSALRIQSWIAPIRALYATSDRPEIVELRQRNANKPVVEEPKLDDPGFRALVEENVKKGVQDVASDPVILEHYHQGDAVQPLYIHGWVYDIATGKIKDLGVTIGPPGHPPVSAPPEVVRRAIKRDSHNHL